MGRRTLYKTEHKTKLQRSPQYKNKAKHMVEGWTRTVAYLQNEVLLAPTSKKFGNFFFQMDALMDALIPFR